VVGARSRRPRVLAVGMDLTILSVALPTWAGALHASESTCSGSPRATPWSSPRRCCRWTDGRPDGRKKVMLISLASFAIGSIACAYSRTPIEFIGARVLLGFAGAGLIVMAVSPSPCSSPRRSAPKASWYLGRRPT